MKPEQVLYMDTGSTIYKRSAGLPELPTVFYLGQFKDELPEKDTIVELLPLGPRIKATERVKAKSNAKSVDLVSMSVAKSN